MTLDELNEKSMEMIVAAGEARSALNQALEAIDDIEKYDELMEEARKAITRSHTAQTKVLQGTITDPDFYPNILFTHAQDTLMTVMSEINTARSIGKVYRKVLEKINER
ncbi:MAG: PTS lactose/cellobiose transporter subunit IIA [Solobacterium sp.]|nr:PTS lactose/cellobiose transporter subunit IIA [Solobacterium sp.]